MSQVEVNTNFNSVNVENTINTIDVNQDFGNILVVPQLITNVVEILTPGPQGAKGEPGNPDDFTSSFVGTASFNAFTASYYVASASFDIRILTNSSSIGIISSSFISFSGSYLNDSSSFNTRILANSSSIGILSSSFLNTSASLSASISLLSGSYLASSASFDFRILTNSSSIGVLSSSFLIASASFDNRIISITNVTGSYATTGSNTFKGNQIISGTLSVTNGITGSLFGTASHVNTLVSASYQTSTDVITFFYGNNTSASFNVDNTNSASYAATASYADDFKVAGTLTAQTIIVQTVTSSVIYSSGSNVFGNDLSNTQVFTGSVKITGSLSVNGVDYISTSASFDNRILANSSSIGILSSSFSNFSSSFSTGSFNGSFSGSFNGTVTGSFSGSLNNLRGTATHVPYFSSSQVLADSAIYQVDNGFSVAINQNGVTTAAPEALYVWQPSTSSFNVISGKGNLDNYLQLNIQNTNQGVSASSDIVATANNGNENTNYIDMGINNENFNGPVGEGNDAYLYSTGRHLHIGNASNFPVQFFVGGTDTDINRKLQLNSNNQHELTGSLNISNILIVNNGITGSLFGTASYAVSASQATNTNNALTASYVNPLRQKVEITGSFEVTGSATFNGPVGVIDSNVYLLDSSSLFLNSGSSIFVEAPGVISGSIVGIGNVTAFSSSVNSRLTALETLIDGGFY
jgi:hypothetical protein